MSAEVFDLVITNGRLVLEDGVVDGGLAISEGRIVQLLGPGETPPAKATRDVGGQYVLPGLIDAHVHFRTPGLTHKETWLTASRAAAAGGITTVIDMPNTNPTLTHTDQLGAKLELIEGNSLVDYAFHLGVESGKVDALEAIDPDAVASIKVFMAGHHTAPNVISNQAELEQIFSIAARRNLPVILHAEDTNIFRLFETLHSAPSTVAEYSASRPSTAGVVAIARVIELVQRYKTRTHILHVSSAAEVDLLEAAAHYGLPITFEVTPHHLSLTEADGARIGTRAKISPALRTEADRVRLWQAVRSGLVFSIGSDHAPHTIEEKSRPFIDAPPGLPGVQELLPAVLTGLASMCPDMTPDERVMLVARLCAANPAKLFGIAERKGALAPGRDADVVVLDLDRQWKVTVDSIQALCGWSAYEGWSLVGVPTLTMRRGEVIYEDGQFGAPNGAWLSSISSYASDETR